MSRQCKGAIHNLRNRETWKLKPARRQHAGKHVSRVPGTLALLQHAPVAIADLSCT